MFKTLIISAWTLVITGAIALIAFVALSFTFSAWSSSVSALAKIYDRLAWQPYSTFLSEENRLIVSKISLEKIEWQTYLSLAIILIFALLSIALSVYELVRLKRSQMISKPFVKVYLVVLGILAILIGQLITFVFGAILVIAFILLEAILFSSEALNNYAEERNLIDIYKEEHNFEREVSKGEKHMGNTNSETIHQPNSQNVNEQEQENGSFVLPKISNEELDEKFQISKFKKVYFKWKKFKKNLEFKKIKIEHLINRFSEKKRDKMVFGFNQNLLKLNEVARKLGIYDDNNLQFIPIYNNSNTKQDENQDQRLKILKEDNEDSNLEISEGNTPSWFFYQTNQALTTNLDVEKEKNQEIENLNYYFTIDNNDLSLNQMEEVKESLEENLDEVEIKAEFDENQIEFNQKEHQIEEPIVEFENNGQDTLLNQINEETKIIVEESSNVENLNIDEIEAKTKIESNESQMEFNQEENENLDVKIEKDLQNNNVDFNLESDTNKIIENQNEEDINFVAKEIESREIKEMEKNLIEISQEQSKDKDLEINERILKNENDNFSFLKINTTPPLEKEKNEEAVQINSNTDTLEKNDLIKKPEIGIASQILNPIISALPLISEKDENILEHATQEFSTPYQFESSNQEQESFKQENDNLKFDIAKERQEQILAKISNPSFLFKEIQNLKEVEKDETRNLNLNYEQDKKIQNLKNFTINLEENSGSTELDEPDLVLKIFVKKSQNIKEKETIDSNFVNLDSKQTISNNSNVEINDREIETFTTPKTKLFGLKTEARNFDDEKLNTINMDLNQLEESDLLEADKELLYKDFEISQPDLASKVLLEQSRDKTQSIGIAAKISNPVISTLPSFEKNESIYLNLENENIYKNPIEDSVKKIEEENLKQENIFETKSEKNNDSIDQFKKRYFFDSNKESFDDGLQTDQLDLASITLIKQLEDTRKQKEILIDKMGNNAILIRPTNEDILSVKDEISETSFLASSSSNDLKDEENLEENVEVFETKENILIKNNHELNENANYCAMNSKVLINEFENQNPTITNFFETQKITKMEERMASLEELICNIKNKEVKNCQNEDISKIAQKIDSISEVVKNLQNNSPRMVINSLTTRHKYNKNNA